MLYKLTKGINNLATYNLGGISHIWLLNINDFIAYKFRDDGLHNSNYVDAIFKENPFLELSSINETNLKTTLTNGIYKQELNTFIHTLSDQTLSWLGEAMNGRYLIAVRAMDNRHFVFGSDGGAKLSYSAQTGQRTELNGVNIQLEKSSIYPLFEVNPDALKTRILGSETSSYIILEKSNNTNTNYLIEIK